ncbi:hypothetical protein [Streptomyces sp. NPDC058583]
MTLYADSASTAVGLTVTEAEHKPTESWFWLALCAPPPSHRLTAKTGPG